jgi:hypothetical protein
LETLEFYEDISLYLYSFARNADGTLCPESGVSAGFGYWLSYEDNGDLKSRSEISNGEIVYELPDNFKDIEDDEDEGEEPF